MKKISPPEPGIDVALSCWPERRYKMKTTERNEPSGWAHRGQRTPAEREKPGQPHQNVTLHLGTGWNGLGSSKLTLSTIMCATYWSPSPWWLSQCFSKYKGTTNQLCFSATSSIPALFFRKSQERFSNYNTHVIINTGLLVISPLSNYRLSF